MEKANDKSSNNNNNNNNMSSSNNNSNTTLARRMTRSPTKARNSRTPESNNRPPDPL
jgi:hypothetical protein